MTSPNHVVDNPLSGERITILERPRLTGDPLVWDLLLAPGGRVPIVGPATYGRRW